MYILDTKWKQLGGGAIADEISSDDVYQVTTYAMRYACRAVTLIYPSSGPTQLARSAVLHLAVPGEPELRICEVDIDRLAYGGSLPRLLLPPEVPALTIGRSMRTAP